jgi:hypothetical protein
MHTHSHQCGPDCEAVRILVGAAEQSLSHELRGGVVAVKTFCRICSLPVLVEVLTDYEDAVRHFNVLDDTPMAHKGQHAEVGGWGVHWRLDEVLGAVFPREHHDEIWPLRVWWQERHGQPLNEDEPVVILTDSDISTYREKYMDVELKMLERQINDAPKDRDELEAGEDQVWDHLEVGDEFEISGFKSPFALARHLVTGEQGTLIFQDNPRYYFGWSPDRVI